jgi:hypothetical protein
MVSDDNIAPGRTFEIVRAADRLRGFAPGKSVARGTAPPAIGGSYGELAGRLNAPMGALFGSGRSTSPRVGGARPKRG